MSQAQTSHRHDDAAPPAREVECPHCGGYGYAESTFHSSLDPGAERRFRQPCYLCHGTGKVATEGDADQR